MSHLKFRRPGSIDRRDMLKGLAALGGVSLTASLLAGCGRSAAEGIPAETIRLTQAVDSLAYAQNYIARSEGYYQQRGLSVETIVTDGGGPDVQAVLAGSARFTINDGAQVLTSFKQNRRLVAVAALFDKCLVNATMSTKTARRLGITEKSTFEERITALKGLRIGVTAPGALTWQVARYNLKNIGVSPDTGAKIIGLGAGASVLAALENDQVDVIYISIPFGETAVARGSGITLIDHSAGEDPELQSFMMEGLWVTPTTLDEDGETVRSMVAALTRASDFIKNSRPQDVAAALHTHFPKFPPEVLTSAAVKLQSAVSEGNRWDPSAVETTKKVLSANDLLPASVPATDQLFEDRYL
ncbi:ABC transporter substrate-binding protein [Nonomuraea sp. NPDC048916]|uniref:ABC transporter substrate-binding protein n=1 Tax=Nonomuraea sp. NPDC048916 TaxID=3154232 RepID=UPI0033CDA6E1